MNAKYNVNRNAEYKVVCRDCTFARWCGQARIKAYETLSRHARMRPLHAIELWQLIEVRNPVESLAPLPLGNDDPPF
jgi:hypothetical protein